MIFAPTFFMVMSGFFWGSGFTSSLGLPPGERDVKLVHTAPADSVLYLEWAERGPGKPGGKGIDGFAGDPEVQTFFIEVWKAIESTAARESANGGPEEQAAGKNVPPMIRMLLRRSGCMSATIDEKAGNAGGEAPQGPNIFAIAGAIKYCLVVNGGKDADGIAKHLNELVKLAPGNQEAGLNRRTIPLPNTPPGTELIVHRHKDYFILAYGKGVIDNAIAGLEGKSKGLEDNAEYAAAVKKVAFERTANVTYVNVKAGVAKAGVFAGPMVAGVVQMLGLSTVDTMVACTGVVDGEIRTRRYLGTGGKTEGVLALFSGRGIKPADLQHVPADSDLVMTYSVNAKKVLKAVRTIVVAADKPSAERLEAVIQGFERELGLKLEEDLMEAFGDVWVIYDSKSAGGFYLTSLVASLEVKDEIKAEDVYTKLMDVLEEKLPGINPRGRRVRGANRKQQQFMGHTIYYVNTVGEFDVPFAPAFCLTKTHLLVAPHPQALKAQLRFQKEGGEKFSDRLGKEFELPEGEVLSLTYCETKPLLRMVYAFAPYVGQIVAGMVQSEGAEIDVFALPSARGVLPYFGNSFSTTVRTEDGILSEARNVNPVGSVGSTFTMMGLFGYASMRPAIWRGPAGARPAPPKVAPPQN